MDEGVQARLLSDGIMPRRFLYTSEFETWLRTGLPAVVATKMWGKDIHAKRQLSAVISQFLRCERIFIPGQLRCLRPHELGVWEFKTGDVRVFGWFVDRDVFVAADGGDAYTIKEDELYDEKVARIAESRSAYGVGFISGGDERAIVTL